MSDDPPPQRGDASARVEGQLPLADRATRLVGRDLILPARGHPLDGPSEPPRQPGQQHVLAVGARLHAEAAAHVRRDHAHPALRQLEHPRHLGPDAERGLAGDPHRQLVGGAIEAGEHRAGLERHRRDARLRDPERDHVGGGREGAMNVTFPNGPSEGAVGVDAGEEQRRALGQSRLRLGQRGQGLVLHPDQVESVVGRVGILGHHGGHRRARRVHVGLGQDRVGRHAHVGHEPVHRHGPEVGHVLAGHHQQHARVAPGGLHIEVRDPRVGVGGAEQCRVDAARGPEIVHVRPGAG
jgi:hypothetical protein